MFGVVLREQFSFQSTFDLGLCIGQHQPIRYVSLIQPADTIRIDDTSITGSNFVFLSHCCNTLNTTTTNALWHPYLFSMTIVSHSYNTQNTITTDAPWLFSANYVCMMNSWVSMEDRPLLFSHSDTSILPNRPDILMHRIRSYSPRSMHTKLTMVCFIF